MTDDILMRELCPDGACIGVIGADGLCKECGAASPTLTQNPRNRGMIETDDDGEPAFEDGRNLCPDGDCIGVIGDDGLCNECGNPAEPEGSEGENAAESAAEPDDDEFDSRELCPDGACIGVIGPDGRCRECGLTRDAQEAT